MNERITFRNHEIYDIISCLENAQNAAKEEYNQSNHNREQLNAIENIKAGLQLFKAINSRSNNIEIALSEHEHSSEWLLLDVFWEINNKYKKLLTHGFKKYTLYNNELIGTVIDSYKERQVRISLENKTKLSKEMFIACLSDRVKNEIERKFNFGKQMEEEIYKKYLEGKFDSPFDISSVAIGVDENEKSISNGFLSSFIGKIFGLKNKESGNEWR